MSELNTQQLKKAKLEKLRERLMGDASAEDLEHMKAELEVLKLLNLDAHDHDLDTADGHHDHEHT